MNQSFLEHLKAAGARPAGDDLPDFGDSTVELTAARRDCVVVPLAHLGLLRVAGPDATDFLHSLSTNDVKRLGRGSAQHNSFCSNKGRMLASFLLWREGDAYLLRLAGDLVAAIRKKLTMFVLRSKVTIADAGGDSELIGLAGPRAAALLQEALGQVPDTPMKTMPFDGGTAIRLASERFELRVATEAATAVWDRLAAAARPAGTDVWRSLAINEGVPLVTARLQEEFVPQMANFELLGGVNFQKGCYPGQEIVARTQYLGRLKRRLYLAHVTADTPPAEAAHLYSPDTPDQSCGTVANVAPAPGGGYDLLAVIQMSSADTGDVHLGAPDGPRLSFKPLPYPVG